jgi:uncharacterized protein (TIGR00730 family)
MKTTQDISERTLADAWADLKAHADAGIPLQPDAYRLAFTDPEFLLRRETRGLRIQLEMLKPELEMQAQGIENTIVVFGSARFLPPDEALLAQQAAMKTGDAKAIESAAQKLRNAQYYDQARLFSRLVAGYGARRPPKERLVICTGGGPGIMEAANRGAHEMGALNMGLSISLPHEQGGNRFVSPSLNFKFHYFAMRKMHFMMRATALVAFPGGMGTMDELFEVMTLVQTRKAKPVPIVLFGTDYWKRLINFDVMVEEGTISKEDLALFTYTDDPQVAWDTIKNFYHLE